MLSMYSTLKISLQSSPIGPRSVITAIYTLYDFIALYDMVYYYFGITFLTFYLFIVVPCRLYILVRMTCDMLVCQF